VSETQVVILCGGLGTRLRAVSGNVPKPLVEVAGKPFLVHQIDYLRSQGFSRFLLLAGYRGDVFCTTLEKYNLRYELSIEPEPLGTGGALKSALDFLDEEFILLNGDTYLGIQFVELVEKFRCLPSGGLVCASSHSRSDGMVEVNNLQVQDGKLLAYKKNTGDAVMTHVDAGAGIFRRRDISRYLAPFQGTFSLEEDVWPKMISDNLLAVYFVEAKPFDIGTPERLSEFARYMEKCANVDFTDAAED